MVKNGKRDGRQRFYCKECKRIVYHGNRKSHREKTQGLYFKFFKSWVLSGVTFSFLSENQSRGKTQLWIYFNSFLKVAKTAKEYFCFLIRQINLSALSGVLLIDADYFGRERCVIYYKDYYSRIVLYYRISGRELFTEIRDDVETLINNGYQLKGVVSDGKGVIKQAILYIEMKYFIPKEQILPHQRCLRHLKFQCLTFITQRPKTEAGVSLREIALSLTKVNSNYEKNIFLRWFNRFEDKYFMFLNQRTYQKDESTGKIRWWYTHKYLRRAFILIKRALPFLFLYLDYSFLPKTNNSIEGEFSSLDHFVKRHRGLKKEKLSQFVFWLLVFQLSKEVKLSDILEGFV